MDSLAFNSRYRLDQEIGRGGMGVVYRAVDRLSGQNVALKRVMKPTEELIFTTASDSVDRRLALAQEFQLLASLRHPNIISVLDYGFNVDHLPYFTMDLLHNPVTVSAYADQLPAQDKIDLLMQILQALKYLHRRGIIHRDLKPANILVSNGQLKVLDFGLAVVHHQQAAGIATTSGTLAYMAPEVLMGTPAQETSDLFAVGIIAYELLTGKHPFNLASQTTLIDSILKTTPDLSVIDGQSQLALVLQCLLSKEPELRYQTADDVMSAFAKAMGQPVVLETQATRESFLQASRLVGREPELAKLTELLDQIFEKKGGLRLIGGESGVGKSRLVDDLKAMAVVRGALALRGQEVSEGGGAYQLWREVLRWLSLSTPLDDAEAGVLKAIVPDLEQLLGRTIPNAPDLPPQAAQQRLVATVTAIFQRQQQPLLVILEDIHWSVESLDLLKPLAAATSALPVMILATYRDDERPDLPQIMPGASVMKLNRLSDKDIAELSESMIGPAGRSPQLLDLLQRETEGNVFFVVEVVRTLAEEVGQLDKIGAEPLPEHVFAGGVKQIVQRRLSHIPKEDYALLELAAVLGRQLDESLLAAAEPGRPLQQWFLNCANAAVLEIVDERWRFSHDKLREGLLGELPPDRQKQIHRRAAELIETVYPGSDDYAARLAYYFNVAGDEEKERRYTILAGQQAHRSGALGEAIRLYRRAIELLVKQPETGERNSQELTLRLDLGANLLAAKGYGSVEVFDTYERARELCRLIGNTPKYFAVISGLNVYYILRAKLQTATQLARQAMQLAEMSNESALLVEAYRMMAGSTFWSGDLAESRYYMDKCYEVYEPEAHRQNILTYGQDPAVCVLANGGWLRWFQGYPDQAVAVTDSSIALAEKVDHMFSLCFAQSFKNRLHMARFDLEALEQGIQRLAKVAADHNIRSYTLYASLDKGWLLAMRGNPDEGIPPLKQAIGIMQSLGSVLTVPFYLTMLAQAYTVNGQHAEALKTIDEALSLFPENECRVYEPEMYRMKGEILLKLSPGDSSAAVECFQQALASARKMQARLLELRAAISLYRVQGDGARPDLAQVYDWFTEGFETPDYQEARVLLGKVELTE